MAGSVKLGEESTPYTSAAMNAFAPIPDRQSKPCPDYKNYNQKVDIISGEVRDTNSKNSGYERFTAGQQHLRSGDQSVYP